MAVNIALYGTLTDPAVSEVVLIAKGLLTVMALLAISTAAVGVCESVTCTLKVVVPSAVGVPLITPPVLMFNPAGRVPELRAQVNGPTPPVDVQGCRVGNINDCGGQRSWIDDKREHRRGQPFHWSMRGRTRITDCKSPAKERFVTPS